MAMKVNFNGTEYSSPDDMPPDIRAAYDRALELAAQGNSPNLPGAKVNVKFSTKVRFAYNGKVYDSPDELPPDVKAKYDKAMEQIDRNHNGMPDMLENNAAQLTPQSPAPPVDSFATTDGSSLQQLAPSQPVIAPEGPNTRILLIGAAVIGLALLIAIIALGLVVIQH